jgi:hypothetical protein
MRERMSAADQYRRNASECIAITPFFSDPGQRATILALADAWTRLAEQAEKNERLVLPTTSGTAPSSADALANGLDGSEKDRPARAEGTAPIRRSLKPGVISGGG